MGKSGILYLFPVPMGDSPVGDVLPARNIEIIRSVKHFIVENVRSARRFIRLCGRDIDIDSLSLVELNEHTPAADIPQMLAPLEEGFDIGLTSRLTVKVSRRYWSRSSLNSSTEEKSFRFEKSNRMT